MLLFITACKHEQITLEQPGENFRTATDFIQNNYDLTLFSAVIEQAGLGDKLRQTKDITVFAPNDAAFKTIGITSIAAIKKMSIEDARLLVQAHIASGLITSQADNIPNKSVDNRFVNLNGDFLYLAATSACAACTHFMYVNGAVVSTIGRDLPLLNGILHIIDVPLKYAYGTTQHYLTKSPQYTVFCEALKKFGLWDKLNGTELFTVFPVNNEKLAAAGITSSSLSSMNPNDYHPALYSCYIVPGHILTHDPVVLFPNELSPRPTDLFGQFALYKIGDSKYQTGVAKKQGMYPLFRDMTALFIYDIANAGVLNSRLITASTVGLVSVECTNGVVNELDNVLLTPEEAIK